MTENNVLQMFYDRKNTNFDNDCCNDNHDDNFGDNDDKNDQKTYKYKGFWIKNLPSLGINTW